MANEYNRKTKYPLHISKLYSTKKRQSLAVLIDEELKLDDPDAADDTLWDYSEENEDD